MKSFCRYLSKTEVIHEVSVRTMFIFTHQKVGHGLLPQVAEGLAEVDDEGVVSPEGGLDYGPVRNSAVTRHGVEIQISVQVIRGPFDLHK